MVRPSCGIPLGMLPAVYGGTRSRANPPCNTQPSAPAAPAAPVPQSARRQERMRLPKHDEARAMRYRLPAGMINPADLATQIAPAAAHETLGEQPSMANRVATLVWMRSVQRYNTLKLEPYLLLWSLTQAQSYQQPGSARNMRHWQVCTSMVRIRALT